MKKTKTKARKGPDFKNVALILNGRLDAQNERVERLERKIEHLDRETLEMTTQLGEAREQLALYKAVFGPVWKTRVGFHVVPALMSDNHLNNIIERGFGNETMREAVREELKRRENDDDWHATEGKKSPRQMLKRLALEVEQLKNRPADERVQNVINALKELVR